LVAAARDGVNGVFDGIAPPMARIDFLTAVAAGVGRPRPELTWVDQAFLEERGIEPWAGPNSLPLWLPLPDYAGFMARDVSATVAAGLPVRDLRDTARDTLDWYRMAGASPLRGGLAADQESAALAAWHARA
jgi:hypothetical protein